MHINLYFAAPHCILIYILQRLIAYPNFCVWTRTSCSHMRRLHCWDHDQQVFSSSSYLHQSSFKSYHIISISHLSQIQSTFSGVGRTWATSQKSSSSRFNFTERGGRHTCRFERTVMWLSLHIWLNERGKKTFLTQFLFSGWGRSRFTRRWKEGCFWFICFARWVCY